MVSMTAMQAKAFRGRPADETTCRAAVISDRPCPGGSSSLCELLSTAGFSVQVLPADQLITGSAQGLYDIVLLDVPCFDSHCQNACFKLRDRNAHLPIIVLSDENTVADRIRGYESGADEYIGKPYSAQEVCVRLRSLLRRSGNHKPQNVLSYDDLTIDLASRVVHRGDQHIDLSRREFSLLVYLVQNAEHLLSRQQILENVWANSTTPERSNVVDVYINYLRNKTEQGQHDRLIQTVRGKGYTLHRQRPS